MTTAFDTSHFGRRLLNHEPTLRTHGRGDGPTFGLALTAPTAVPDCTFARLCFSASDNYLKKTGAD